MKMMMKKKNEYGFNFLTNRIYSLLESRKKNKVIVIPPPVVGRYGGRKSVFKNCTKICEKINRDLDHLFKVICSELSTEGSINGDKQMVLRGKFFSKHISKVLIKYIKKYVECDICESLDTTIAHEEGVDYLVCNTCLAKKSIQ